MGSWWRIGDSLLFAAVVAVSLLVIDGRSQVTPFFGDEGDYIGNARYFGYLFLERDLARPEWGDNYWTHTQPMLSRYVIGAWLWARGRDPGALPRPYDWAETVDQNRLAGRIPDEALLREARAPMMAIGAVALGVLYALGRALGGPAAGLAAAGLALASTLVPWALSYAWIEQLMTLWMLLSLLLAVLGARRGRDGGLPLAWAVGVGLTLGLGLASKLTLAANWAAIAGWAALVTALAGWRARGGSPGAALRSGAAAGGGWALALGLALAVFVASNPHLYSDPLLHARHLVDQRVAELRGQQQTRAAPPVYDPVARLQLVFWGSLVQASWGDSIGLPFELDLPLELALALGGAGGLLVTVWRGWRRAGRLPAEGLVALAALTYFFGTSAGLLVAFGKYVLPPFLFGALFKGLSIGWLVGRLRTVAPLHPKPSPVPQESLPRG